MSTDIIDARLKEYKPETLEDEVHILKEIMQEIILYGLSEKQTLNLWGKDFFNVKLAKLEGMLLQGGNSNDQ